jgi:hypothetical protein
MLAGPVLRIRDSRADAPAAPRRLILIASPNGPMVATGPCSGSETSFQFHPWWQPLAKFQQDGIFLSHLCATGASVVPGPSGLAGGHGLGGQVFCGYGCGQDIYTSAGPSIDRIIGQRLQSKGAAGLVPSVAWGFESSGEPAFFYDDANRPQYIETNPSKAWSALFSGGAKPNPSDAALIARRTSILDFVNQDCNALQNALGSEGKRLLDEHCSTIRQMEKNVGTSLGCAMPQDPGPNEWTNPENVDVAWRAFVDLMTTALVCEATHVICFQFGPEAARNHIASSYGVPESPMADSGDSGPAHHPWTHQNLAGGETVHALSIFQTFYSKSVAILIDKLKTTLDASGKPLLDSTMVLWLSELGGDDGNNYEAHITSSAPAVLFGSGQGTFKTGRYVQGPSRGTSDHGEPEGGRMMAQLLISMMQYMGLTDQKTVGVCDANGPLASLYT